MQLCGFFVDFSCSRATQMYKTEQMEWNKKRRKKTEIVSFYRSNSFQINFGIVSFLAPIYFRQNTLQHVTQSIHSCVKIYVHMLEQWKKWNRKLCIYRHALDQWYESLVVTGHAEIWLQLRLLNRDAVHRYHQALPANRMWPSMLPIHLAASPSTFRMNLPHYSAVFRSVCVIGRECECRVVRKEFS